MLSPDYLGMSETHKCMYTHRDTQKSSSSRALGLIL